MSSTSQVVGLDLRFDVDLTLADKIRRAGQAKALVTFAKEIEDHARADLDAEAQAETARTGGGGFSKKVDGVQAVVTDPQPKPRMVDEEAFTGWWQDAGFDVVTAERVEVVDEAAAADAIRYAPYADRDEAEGCLEQLATALKIVTVTHLPEKALDTLLEAGRCIATDDGLLDTQTGELVPGVVCNRAAPQLRVTPDKTAKARDRAIVASFFNLPPQLPGGDA